MFPKPTFSVKRYRPTCAGSPRDNGKDAGMITPTESRPIVVDLSQMHIASWI